VPRVVTGRVDGFQPAGDRQHITIGDVPVDPHRFHQPLRMPDEAVSDPRQQLGSWGGKGHQSQRKGRRLRAYKWSRGFPHDSSRATDVIRMAVREDHVPEVTRGASKLTYRVKHG
jgi:hypothetical protein